MRSLSCLAVAIAALASFACGSPPPDTSNAYVTQGLEGVDGLRLVGEVDAKDPGCTVDGVRFGRCTLTRTTITDVVGESLNVCDLEVQNGGSYSWECDDSHEEVASAVERYQQRVGHCPEGG